MHHCYVFTAPFLAVRWLHGRAGVRFEWTNDDRVKSREEEVKPYQLVVASDCQSTPDA